MNREKTAQIVLAESREEHARRLKQRAEDELRYDPRPDSLYVWELEIGREDVGYGYTRRHTYTMLFATRQAAVLEACEEILRYYGDGYWSQEYREKIQAQMAAGEHEKAIDQWQTHHGGARSFNIRRVEVRA